MKSTDFCIGEWAYISKGEFPSAIVVASITRNGWVKDEDGNGFLASDLHKTRSEAWDRCIGKAKRVVARLEKVRTYEEEK